MITILFSAALALASPVAGQAAPAADPHSGHAEHQGMDHSQHMKSDHDCKKCCEEHKKTGGKMECGMEAKTGSTAAPADDGHQH